MLIVSLVLGVISVIGTIIGLTPCLGWFNWLNLPFAFIGLILSLYLYVNRKDKPRGLVLTALGMNGIAAVVGILRLMLGGGIF